MRRLRVGVLTLTMALFAGCSSDEVDVSDGQRVGPDGITTGTIRFDLPEQWLTFSSETVADELESEDPILAQYAESIGLDYEDVVAQMDEIEFFAYSPRPPRDNPVGNLNLIEFRTGLPSADQVEDELEGFVDELGEVEPFVTQDDLVGLRVPYAITTARGPEVHGVQIYILAGGVMSLISISSPRSANDAAVIAELVEESLTRSG